MGKDDTQSKEIARILERTAANAFKMQADKIITAFKTAEKTCLTLVSTKELELEVKRRVAEWKLKLLCDSNSSFDTVDKLHNEILRLGYSSPENEGDIELYFAQYCVRQNQIDTARRVLHQLCYKLDETIKTNNLEVFHHFRGIAEQLLSTIK
jgi:hypothetical protein